MFVLFISDYLITFTLFQKGLEVACYLIITALEFGKICLKSNHKEITRAVTMVRIKIPRVLGS